MRALILGNSDYRKHTTSEGDQLQEGLRLAGWQIAGFGYPDGCTHVPTLLERYNPDIVFVQDLRDWDRGSEGCYDKRLHFDDYQALASFNGIVVMPLKDAGSAPEQQARYVSEIRPDALVVYYHPDVVRRAAPWLDRDFPGLPLVRTYHSVDQDEVLQIDFGQERKRGIVTGAMSEVYPLRCHAIVRAKDLELDVLEHPGYGNVGCQTPAYLRKLAGYKVHVATASRHDFALRKIIESVAVGCVPVTNLSDVDRLPAIDGALMRIPSRVTVQEFKASITLAERGWNLPERLAWAEAALAFYDYRHLGERLSSALLGLKEKRP